MQIIPVNPLEEVSLNTAILIKSTSFNLNQIQHFYINALVEAGVSDSTLCMADLEYTNSKTVSAKDAKAYLDKLLKALNSLGITTLYVADTNYFKYLTGFKKTIDAKGYVHNCTIKGYEHLKVVLGINYDALIYNDNLKSDLHLSIQTLSTFVNNGVNKLGANVIHTSEYPDNYKDIAKWLCKLHQYPQLTCDIETYSLRFEQAGIATIGFAWDTNNGIAFKVDHEVTSEQSVQVRKALKEFFESYQGSLIFHNSAFEIKIFAYQLFMDHDTDFKGMRKGINTFKKCDDTQALAFLALNSTADIKLSLKELAYTYMGNYAEDVTDITQIPVDRLLEYNLKDCLATWYVYNTYLPLVKKDNLLDFYTTMSMPSIFVVVKMMLIGLPIDPARVQEVTKQTSKTYTKAKAYIARHPLVKEAEFIVQKASWKKANSQLKKKIKPLSDFSKEKFNIGSPLQLQVLLYQVMKLPVLQTTDTGQPSTSGKVIKRLLDYPDVDTKLLNALLEVFKVDKLITSFLPAFKELPIQRQGKGDLDGSWWLNGNLNTTGTQSGRLSSNSPNMQNLPSTKLIKSCFRAPNRDWLFCFADFTSLEAKINAILTNDPNKKKVYTDGYDSHSLATYAYFVEQLPDIDPGSVDSINSIADKYSELRTESKPATFACQYGGTWITLVNNLGFSEEKAKIIEQRYLEMYEVSTIYANTLKHRAVKQGYIDLAFGMKLRTPVLGKTAANGNLPYQAEAEGRSAYNADSQSYGLLMNRALIQVDNELSQESDELQDSILPLNTIHDAGYYLVRNEPKYVKWLNDHLINAMTWQDLPPIRSNDIIIGAELDVGYSWDNCKTLPNNASITEVEDFLKGLNND